jgi:hypothetical protein
MRVMWVAESYSDLRTSLKFTSDKPGRNPWRSLDDPVSVEGLSQG